MESAIPEQMKKVMRLWKSWMLLKRFSEVIRLSYDLGQPKAIQKTEWVLEGGENTLGISRPVILQFLKEYTYTSFPVTAGFPKKHSQH